MPSFASDKLGQEKMATSVVQQISCFGVAYSNSESATENTN